MASTDAAGRDARQNGPFLRALRGEAVWPPPIWMMRQAGRYLPEYREIRAKAGSFLDLCYNPALATEVTLQPIRRYGFDASILFSDILVIPHALGRDLRFEEGLGPRLDPITVPEIAALRPETVLERLGPVLETVERLREALPPETPLIGFCGAPWTVATYMIHGRGSPDQAGARAFAHREPEAFAALLDVLTQASILYLDAQVKAGADALMVFDSWAGALDTASFATASIGPNAAIVSALKARHPAVPVLAFPKGAGARYPDFLRGVKPDGVGLDWSIDPAWAAREIRPLAVPQGNLDPTRLVAGGAALDQGIDAVLDAFGGGP
ncbi:MAG: uroporphyrinogen decarboxylase, partial [Pseudomonadota bacterium]